MASVNRLKPLKTPIRWKEYEQTLTRLYQSWDQLSREQQISTLEQVMAMKASREQDPQRFLIPNGAQEKVIRDVGNMEYFIVLSCFANGVGKSAINIAILGAIMFGASSTAFDYPLYREYPKRWPKLIRIATEPALVGHMGPVQVESKLWWPKDRYEWTKGGKQYNSFFETDTGFKGEVMTFEQAVKEFEGKTNAINLFIEPPPRDILFACFARQRKGGVNLIDMTPLTSSAYIKDEIVDKPEIVLDGKPVGRVSCIHADIEENCEDHGKNGQLKHNDILQIISRYDPDEIEARAHGQFMHLSGRIFKGFDRAVHVAAEEFRPPKNDVTIHMACDPAIAKPLAMLWAYVSGDGVLRVYDEYPEYEFNGAKDSNLTVTDYAEIIKRKEAGLQVESRLLDRHFGAARRTVGGLSLKDEFAEVGIEFRDSYTCQEEVETGILKVKELLRWDKSKPQGSLNQPRILISPKCRNLIASLERWGRDQRTGKPQDEFKDFSDVLRYLAMSNPEFEVARPWVNGGGAHYGVGNKL